MNFNFKKSGVFLVSKSSNVSKNGKVYNRFNVEIDDNVMECNVDDEIYNKLNKHDIFSAEFNFRSGSFNGSHYEVLSIIDVKKEK